MTTEPTAHHYIGDLPGQTVLQRIGALAAAGRHPLAVLDIDLTLIETAPRTRAVIAAWCEQAGLAALAAEAHQAPLVFSIVQNLKRVGVPDLRISEAMAFWRTAFFDPAMLVHDAPLPGAIDAVRALGAAGATIVYLTARPASMAAGTTTRFQELGFPIAGPGAVLVTKDAPLEHDEAYKRRALAWIQRLGTAVVCADNEPAMANAMHEAFPEALTVLVATRHSEAAPPLMPGVRRVAGLAELIR